MNVWHRGRVYVRKFSDTRLIEIRDDVSSGWLWQLHNGCIPSTWDIARTLAAAKRAAMREAKRLGWVR